MDPRHDSRRQQDLDWLYGSERPSIDQTRVMDKTELAELERRRTKAAQSAAATGAQAAQAANPPQAQQPQRVVHSEADVTPRPSTRSRRDMATEEPRREPSRPVAPPPPPQPPRTRPTAPPAARPPAGRPRGRRNWARLVGIALLAWLVWLVAVPMVALTMSNKVQEQPSGDRPAKQPGTTTLLVGSDAREDLSAEEQAKLGTGTETGKRTDTMMLLYTPDSGRPVLVSLPRDSYVSIPGYGHNKLNAAYSLGGPQLLVKTVEQNTGLRVDNYMEVGFDGFSKVVDAVGGVKMCLESPMVDKDSHTNLPAGCQKLSGTNALGYVRMRKADPTGDLGRMKRQRAMMGAIVKKSMSPMTFINPVRYWRLNMAVSGAVLRGEDTGITDLASAGNSIRKISGGDGLQLAVPLANANATTAAGSSILWDDEAAADMFGQMARGDTSGLDKYAK